ncbi:MAG: GNAT family N-acetyltransferase [bacterium]
MIPRNGVRLSGSKTILRSFERVDCDRMAMWVKHSNPLFVKYDIPQRTQGEWDDWFRERILPEDTYAFSIDETSGRMVGWLVLREVCTEERRASLGIDLNPECLYQGLGSDAINTILNEFFGPWGFRAMWLEVSAANVAAQWCYGKCGFMIVGRKWWNETHLTQALLLEDERLREVRRFFRSRDGMFEQLYYDMKVTADSWRSRMEQCDF